MQHVGGVLACRTHARESAFSFSSLWFRSASSHCFIYFILLHLSPFSGFLLRLSPSHLPRGRIYSFICTANCKIQALGESVNVRQSIKSTIQLCFLVEKKASYTSGGKRAEVDTQGSTTDPPLPFLLVSVSICFVSLRPSSAAPASSALLYLILPH